MRLRFLFVLLFAARLNFSIASDATDSPRSIIALSLARAEAMARAGGHHLRSDLTFGWTDVIGFILVSAPEEPDVVVLGRRRTDGRSLGLDDVAHLFRTSRFGGLTGPGISLEPSHNDRELLEAVYFNNIESNWLGTVSYKSDFLGKALGLGTKPSGLSNMRTYADRMLEILNARHGESFEILSRFWFVPAYIPVVSDSGIWLLTKPKVAVMVENLHASIGGIPQTNFIDTAAQDYASEFTSRFAEFSAKHVEIADLQAMMGSLQISAILLQNAPSNRLDYWLNSYQPQARTNQLTAPRLRRMIGANWGKLEVHGGVRAAGMAIRLRRSELQGLREVILDARPHNPLIASWRVPLDESFIANPETLPPEQLKAARHFVAGTALREAKRFEEAASEFESAARIAPDSVESRFLGALCRREALVAASRVDELDLPVAELTKLAAEYPNIVEIQYEWAVSQRILGKDESAIRILESLLGRAPDFASAQFVLGMSHYRLGHQVEAAGRLAAYLAAAKPGPSTVEARRVIAELKAPRTPVKLVPYENGFFSMPRPSSWKTLSGAETRKLLSSTPGSAAIEVAFIRPQNPDCNTVITVAPFPTEALTLDQVTASLTKIEKAHQRRFNGYKHLEGGPVTINGVVGVRFVFASDRLGAPFKHAITTLVWRHTSVTIASTAPEQEFDVAWQEAFRMIESLRFTTLLDE